MIIKPTTPKIYTPQDKYALDLDGRDVRGSKIYDRSGNPNHGAITGAVIKPMNYGLPVLSFDGVDDKINCGHDTSLDITDELTIEMWINMAQVASSRGFLEKGLSSATCNYAFGTGSANNNFRFRYSGVFIDSVAHGYSVGEWHQAVVTVNTVSNVLKFYSDGVQLGADRAFTGVLTANNEILRVAHSSDGYFKGQIASVQILKRERKESEISQRYNDFKHLFGK